MTDFSCLDEKYFTSTIEQHQKYEKAKKKMYSEIFPLLIENLIFMTVVCGFKIILLSPTE